MVYLYKYLSVWYQFRWLRQWLIIRIKKNKTLSISTQTGDFYEIFINLSSNKNIRLYYSSKYKDYVLSINFGKCKKYIITRPMWKKLRQDLWTVDRVLYKWQFYFNLSPVWLPDLQAQERQRYFETSSHPRSLRQHHNGSFIVTADGNQFMKS